jgi:D-arabinose 1-dehydrogenase-like Zn-dependent alcohol dehydrogenase
VREREHQAADFGGMSSLEIHIASIGSSGPRTLAGHAYLVALRKSRQKLAREFGATDIVAERGDEAVARIQEMTLGIGADAVLECVGTQESIIQGIRSTRPGGSIGYVGVPHGVGLDAKRLFFAGVRLHGGPAPVRRYLPALIDLVWRQKINPRQGFRPDPATRSGCGGLSRDGRTARDQDAVAADGGHL